jgi:hypothetical protein
MLIAVHRLPHRTLRRELSLWLALERRQRTNVNGAHKVVSRRRKPAAA